MNIYEAQNELNRICLEVEKECPVGKAFGISGIGEGIVIKCINTGFEDSGFWAKIKGDKHANSKVKTLATVDVEKVNNLKELAAKVAHEGRLEQGVQAVFGIGNDVDVKQIGDVIQWVMRDIFKEEMDTIAASGFTGKELNSHVAKIVRDYVMNKL